MLTRILSGIVGIAIAAAVIQTGGAVFCAAVIALMMIGWHEYAKAFSHMGQPLAYRSGMAAMLLMGGAACTAQAELFRAAALSAILWVLTLTVFRHRSFSVPQAALSVAGILYVGFTLSHLIFLRMPFFPWPMDTPLGKMEMGCVWLWVALIGTWASDTFAYFTGVTWGRHRLCEAISPKKSVEGFVGGLLGTAASVSAIGAALSWPLLPMAALGVAIALLATVGDLVESAIKRYAGIKDSGVLIPGHGGVLDRFDSVMFVVPFVYYVSWFASLLLMN